MNTITPSGPPTNAVVGGTAYTPSATVTTGSVLITLDGSSSGCTLTAGVVSFTGVGTCVVDFNDSGTANYGSATVSQSFGVGKGVNAISPSAPPSHAIVGGTTYSPFAGSTAGTVVIILDGSSSGCTLNGGVVSFTAGGTCVIDFIDSGDPTTAPQSLLSHSLCIRV